MTIVEKIFDTVNGQTERPSEDRLKWVQCEGFRCLGYRDKDGNWRNSYTGEVLPKVIGILEL
jgi:hypothetical protein